MKITRKEFLKAGSLVIGGTLLGGAGFARLLNDEPKGFKTLKNNIGIFTERGGTILWYASKNGIAVVDAQMPDSAKNFYAGLKTKENRRINFLFNTHHHGDHTAGNFYLKDFTDHIAANENCARLQKEKYGQGNNAANQAYPDITFGESANYSVGNEKIEASHFNPAHTGGDSIYHFVNSDILHVGDLVFNRLYPFFFPTDGGSILGWIDYLEKIIKKYSKNTIFIFGHSYTPETVTGSIDDVVYMKNYLSALVDFVKKEKSAGKSRDEVSKTQFVPGFEKMIEMRDGLKAANLTSAYDEISKL